MTLDGPASHPCPDKTPEAVGKVVQGKMFSDTLADYDAFFEFGPGAMCWSADEQNRRTLWFIAPDGVTARIYANRSKDDWAVPGDVIGWDGDISRPTFTPSIWLNNKKGWHGFIQKGDMVSA